MKFNRIIEHGVLLDHLAKNFAAQLERENETVIAEFVMANCQVQWHEPIRQAHPASENLQKVMLAFEKQGVFGGFQLQRHADAVTDVFLQTRRACEPLGAVHCLRKAARAAVLANPKLAIGFFIFRHDHDCGLGDRVLLEG